MKVLFVHNTIADYRIPFFCKLNEQIPVEYLFTRIELSQNIYGNQLNYGKISNLNYSYLPNGKERYSKIRYYFKNNTYDVVILPPMDSLKDYIDAMIIFFYAKKKKCKIIYFGEKWEAPKEKQPLKKQFKNMIQRMAFKIILKNINMCIVSGSKSKEYFKSIGIKENRISLAIDASGMEIKENTIDIRKENNIEKSKKIILYYGRIIKRKGLEILLKSYENIQALNENVCLIICGTGEYKDKCEEIAKKLKLKNVFFKGYVEPEDRYTYFSQCDIFVLPSYFYEGTPEAWGLTVNEALQCGKPVIATEAVGAAYDLINGKNGRMIKENNVFEMTNAINYLLSIENLHELKKECEKTYKQYSYDNMVQSFISAIIKTE